MGIDNSKSINSLLLSVQIFLKKLFDKCIILCRSYSIFFDKFIALKINISIILNKSISKDFYAMLFRLQRFWIMVPPFTFSYSRSCDELGGAMYYLPWVNTTSQNGYLQLTYADSPFSHYYRVPGTVQNYVCRKWNMTKLFFILFLYTKSLSILFASLL